MDVVTLSRLQFGLTAMYHFLFVPLTLGLSVLLAIMESIYVTTGRTIWRDMMQFWGMLFGINFAMGVATGITMEFQFGTNWAYYAHYVGDIFGAPLAIEGLMAFFLEATFVGLFFFGWERLSPRAASDRHLPGGARHQPLGAVDPDRQRLDAVSGRRALQSRDHAHGGHRLLRRAVQPGGAGEVRAHRVAPATSPARCSCCRSAPSICCAGRNRGLAMRSMTVAASFGLASALSVVVLGDESGYTAGAEPEDEDRRDRGDVADRTGAGVASPWSAFPTSKTHETDDAIRVPWVLGLIATRSLDGRSQGIDEPGRERGAAHPERHDRLWRDADAARAPDDRRARGAFDAHVGDLGYALLLKRYTPTVTDATPAQIAGGRLGHGAAGACRCSGPSASWWGSASTSSRCSALMFCAGLAPPA